MALMMRLKEHHMELRSNIHEPWIIGGDFNSLLQLTERMGGDQVSYAEVEDLVACIDD